MKLGIHAYAWCSQWSNETLHLADKVKALRLDFIEIPLMCLETLDAAATRARLEANALDVCTSTVLLEGTDITSDDAPTRKRGVDYLKDCVQGDPRPGRQELLRRDLLSARQGGYEAAGDAAVATGGRRAVGHGDPCPRVRRPDRHRASTATRPT